MGEYDHNSMYETLKNKIKLVQGQRAKEQGAQYSVLKTAETDNCTKKYTSREK